MCFALFSSKSSHLLPVFSVVGLRHRLLDAFNPSICQVPFRFILKVLARSSCWSSGPLPVDLSHRVHWSIIQPSQGVSKIPVKSFLDELPYLLDPDSIIQLLICSDSISANLFVSISSETLQALPVLFPYRLMFGSYIRGLIARISCRFLLCF